MPLITVIIVIVHPIVDDIPDLLEPLTARNVDFIFHMAEEALLRSIVPAVATAGHRLAKFSVLHDLDETVAGIVTALVTMNQSFCAQ